MDSGGDAILIIGGLLSLIALVAFFFLCDNVTKIREKISPRNDSFEYHFNLLLALHKKEEAEKLLIDTMINARDVRRPDIILQIEDVLNKYHEPIEQIGLTVDYDFLNSLKKSVCQPSAQ